MSHGCSGDIWRRDYTRPAKEWNAKLTIDQYAKGLVDIAMAAYQGIRYRADVDPAMAGAPHDGTTAYPTSSG